MNNSRRLALPSRLAYVGRRSDSDQSRAAVALGVVSRGFLTVALFAMAFRVQFFLYLHKKICIMPKKRVLLAWIGHSDFRPHAERALLPNRGGSADVKLG